MATNMEVDTSKSTVMASAGTSGSVSVSLHPLVIMNISEHWTRVRAQEGKPKQGRVFLSEHHVGKPVQAFGLLAEGSLV